MATLVLQVAGSAIGTALGGPIGGAIGSALGGLAGSAIDQSLMGGGGRRMVEGPRLKQLDGITASEGAPIPRVYGRVRIGGQVIWATRFEEQVEVSRQGKTGGKSTGSKQRTVTTTYSYFANLAVGLCEGPIAFVRRVWADGAPLDLTTVTMRVHRGDETQEPDPLIAARQGPSPGYRGTAYVVFERLPLSPYGNRLPQLSFEVVRAVDGLAQMIRGVDLIPGASEFGYLPAPVSRVLGLGATVSENRNQFTAASDMEASLDALEALCPNAQSIALVSTWFGDDLRAGQCRVRPCVDSAIKVTSGAQWSVAGLARAGAGVVSQIEGRAAFGGTPSDGSILAAVADLKARGLSVVFYPFVMMDVPAGNTLPDPWTGAAGQPTYPWRGRITCSPAPGRPGSPDGTTTAASQIAAFFGTVQASHFAVSGSDIAYTGPDEWSYSRLVLHSAALCKAAGGVDAFVIGSELVGLTRVRSGPGDYPAVARLRTLAAEVRALLGSGTKIGYGADWTEYGAHVLASGAEVRFPLDPLWADANIDFIGIDYYPPVADWRDGDHLDAGIAASGSDVAYLKDRLGAGEAFDWYYASDEDRADQIRTPITDGAYGKPWTYRAKDLVGWWSNAHIQRVGGVETGATGWSAKSKPIWLTEVGCPAVDKGANAPNLFPDPKSDESGLPPFSDGSRDDLVQARLLEAVMRRFDPATSGFSDADNPVSPVYGGRMVDPARIHVWAWDARPFPAFPHLTSVWGDGANWPTGHWLNGRIEGMPVDRLIAAIIADYGLDPAAFQSVDGFADGYVIDRPMSARAALQGLCDLFAVDASPRSGIVTFAGRGRGDVVALTRDDLTPDAKGLECARTRMQETELPRQVTLGFVDAEHEYKRITAGSRQMRTVSRREQSSETSIVLRRAEAQKYADIALQDQWIGRETAEFSLRSGLITIEPGDIVSLDDEASGPLYQIVRVTDGAVRRCSARAIEPAIFYARAGDVPLREWSAPQLPGPATAIVLDLPVDPGEPTPLALLALRADPWSGPYTILRSANGASFEAVGVVSRPAIIGETLEVLPAGPCWRWDNAASLMVRIAGGAFASAGDVGALAGATLVGVRGDDGVWEVLTFATAVLQSPGVWRLSRLLRGLYGSEGAASRAVPSGSTVVVLDDALTPLLQGLDEVAAHAYFRVAPAGRDHADPSAIAFEATAGASALRPLAPVRVRASRGAAGVTLSWLRRTRRGGDNWELLDAPLAEESERYQVDILSGASVRRTCESSVSSTLYATADEIVDFGAAQTQLWLRIRQISRATGPGAAFEGLVPVI